MNLNCVEYFTKDWIIHIHSTLSNISAQRSVYITD